jgi:hypothetical protein
MLSSEISQHRRKFQFNANMRPQRIHSPRLTDLRRKASGALYLWMSASQKNECHKNPPEQRNRRCHAVNGKLSVPASVFCSRWLHTMHAFRGRFQRFLASIHMHRVLGGDESETLFAFFLLAHTHCTPTDLRFVLSLQESASVFALRNINSARQPSTRLHKHGAKMKTKMHSSLIIFYFVVSVFRK